MTRDGVFVMDGKGRAVAFECATDIVMRAGLDRDADLKRKVTEITGKPIREMQMDHKPGLSRPFKCFKCNRHFTPDQKIETRVHVPYYDAGERQFHADCLASY